MEVTDELKSLLIDTAKQLQGSARRHFMARTVKALGPGGASRAEREFGWNRKTIRKGTHEVDSGLTCLDAFGARGRKRGVAHRHHDWHQAQSVGLLPYQSGQKQAPKKLAATDAIFEQLSRVNAVAESDAQVVRISMEAKATVKVGDFSRRGKKRVRVKAADHDFKPSATVTPVGILLPQSDDLFLACVTSKVTSDCLVDVLEQWWQSERARFEQVRTLVINLDNGPENQSQRTQFLNRLVAFAQTSQLTVTLAYDPPYHSKYNPVERCWGVLATHWNGDLLDTVETVVKFAQTMTWKGKHPVVRLITQPYPTGVRLTKQAMAQVETHLERLTGLERWFVSIPFSPPTGVDT